MPYAYKVPHGENIRLKDFDPADHGGLSEAEAIAKTAEFGEKLWRLQALMYAAGQTSMLIVLQGIDTSGKDGTIRGLVHHLNAQMCRVASFKVPTELELGHDFLWRIHAQTPTRGSMAIFNRSHYEDVLVARVHDIVPKDVWKKRYDQINEFEHLLASANCLILKFFLHISKDEQEQRLLEREKDPDKAWKLSVGDWKERELWKDYTEAYEDALNKCSTKKAPWFIVPSNHKWYRNLAVIEQVTKALEEHKEAWHEHLKEVGVAERREIDAYRAGRKA